MEHSASVTTATLCNICSASLVSSSHRCRCSGRPRQPLPGEPAGPTHPQPNADEPHALRLRRHSRARVLPFRAGSAHRHGAPGWDGSDWLHGARDGSGCRRWRQRGDPVFHVSAPAPDERAIPGWGAVCWNHQPFPFVRGCEKLAPPPFFNFFYFGSLKAEQLKRTCPSPCITFISNY